MLARVCWIAPLGLLLFLAQAARAQEEAPPRRTTPRLWLSGWGGGFTGMGGFSHGPDDFYQFDGTIAYGGSVHFDTGAGILVGVDAVFANPDYTRFDRDSALVRNEDQAKIFSALASARFAGGGGQLGIYLAGGAGIFSWDVPDIGTRNTDLTLNVGIGAELRLLRWAAAFGQYDQWWVYHEKEDVQRNTATHNLLRFGLRAGIG